jgi:hypothetical protein
MELSEQPLPVKNVVQFGLYVVVHEHWPVSQRMIVEMGDYAWSEHIVTVFLACQITTKNVQVQLTITGKTIPDSYTPTPKGSCAQNVVVLK